MRALAASLHVDLDVTQHGSGKFGVFLLRHIARTASAAIGSGAAILRALCNLADQFGHTLSLDCRGGAPGLIAFFERFGFRLRGRSGMIDPPMSRPPAK